MRPISMLRISLTAGLLPAIGCFAPTLAAPTGILTESTIVFCSDTRSGNCLSAFRGSTRDWLLAATEGVKRPTLHRDLENQQMHVASANQPSATNSTEAPPTKRNGSGGFVFDASSVKHSTKPALLIRLGEKITKQALKRRFAGYDVRYTTGEGCLTCAVITGTDGQFDVDFDHDGRTVINLRSIDDRARDVKGNSVGSPLAEAIGSNTANCDAGESTTCASPDVKGLLYVVAEDDQCPFTVTEKQPTDIPACARIGGIQILGN
jgi:hypothetical protein